MDIMQTGIKRHKISLTAFVLLVMIGRVLHLHYERHTLYKQLVTKYDTSPQDKRMSNADVIRLLGDNGIHVTKEQFKQWVGVVDDEGDGFDESELMEALEMFDDFG